MKPTKAFQRMLESLGHEKRKLYFRFGVSSPFKIGIEDGDNVGVLKPLQKADFSFESCPRDPIFLHAQFHRARRRVLDTIRPYLPHLGLSAAAKAASEFPIPKY